MTLNLSASAAPFIAAARPMTSATLQQQQQQHQQQQALMTSRVAAVYGLQPPPGPPPHVHLNAASAAATNNQWQQQQQQHHTISQLERMQQQQQAQQVTQQQQQQHLAASLHNIASFSQSNNSNASALNLNHNNKCSPFPPPTQVGGIGAGRVPHTTMQQAQQQQQQQQLPSSNTASGNSSAAPQGVPSLSQSPLIRDVWGANLHEEFAVIRSLLDDYPYVAMDTEFPGVVAKPVGAFKDHLEYYYQTIRLNVNMLKIIQIGITLLNEKGEVPEVCCTWQFNFAFSLKTDTYATESIQLLNQGGLHFDYFSVYGIDVNQFAALLISSGMVCNPNIRWLAFHAGYDFGYLVRIIYSAELPEKEAEFMERFHFLFPRMFDLKYLLRQTSLTHSCGLDFLADNLHLKRFGCAHQAGSDSLLTGHCFFRLLSQHLKGSEDRVSGNGVLYGLSEDTVAASSAASSGGSAQFTSGLAAAAPDPSHGGAAAAVAMNSATSPSPK